MKAKITFKQQNPDFDKEYAKIYHHGEQSHDNMKDNWSMTMGIEGNVVAINIQKDTCIHLAGVEVGKVSIFEYKTDTGEICQFVVSDSLIDKIHQAGNSKYKSSHLYVYFKNTDEYYTYQNGGQLMYFACDEYPAELKKYLVGK